MMGVTLPPGFRHNEKGWILPAQAFARLQLYATNRVLKPDPSS